MEEAKISQLWKVSKHSFLKNNTPKFNNNPPSKAFNPPEFKRRIFFQQEPTRSKGGSKYKAKCVSWESRLRTDEQRVGGSNPSSTHWYMNECVRVEWGTFVKRFRLLWRSCEVFKSNYLKCDIIYIKKKTFKPNHHCGQVEHDQVLGWQHALH